MAVPRGTSVMVRCDIRNNNNGVALVPNVPTPLGIWPTGNRGRSQKFLDFIAAAAGSCEKLNGVITMTFLKNFLRDESGASAAEYALILAIVGAGIALAAYNLGGAIGNSMNAAASCISSASASTAPTC